MGVSACQCSNTCRRRGSGLSQHKTGKANFLAWLGMVMLSIFLRQRGSPESKPVDAPHSQTGSE